MKHPLVRAILLAGPLLAMTVAAIEAQPASGDDEQVRFLDVRRRQVELRAARAELQRDRELFEQGLVSSVQLDESVTQFERAQLNYQEAILTLVYQPPRITIQRAVKMREEDGRQLVRLTVANLTPTLDDEQFRLLNDFEGAEAIPGELRTKDLRDVFISLQGTAGGPEGDGVTIALPYEHHVAELPYGESTTLVFQLLRDTQSVRVSTSYKGRERSVQVQLEQAKTRSVVNVTSTQVSQEVDLGGEGVYDLRLDRSTVDVRTFQLRVFNLPPEIHYQFRTKESEARLSQLSIAAGVVQQDLRLHVFLPDRVTDAVTLDQTLELFAVVMDDEQARAWMDVDTLRREALEASRAGWVRLELIPRGIGRIEVRTATLFGEVAPGESFETTATIQNSGTRALDNVTIRFDAPLEWRVAAAPDRIASLESGGEASISITMSPPAELPSGDYEIRIIVDSFTSSQAVQAKEKSFRIRVESRIKLWALALLVLTIVALVAGVALMWIRINRR
jgi:hypothetical protein